MRGKHLFLVIILIIAGGFFLLRDKMTQSIRMPNVSEFRKLAYQTQLDEIKKLAQTDPIKSWDYLKSVFLVNGQAIGNAHGLAHLVGNAMHQKYNLAGITNCDPTFAYGCFHGVTEQLLFEQGTSVIPKIQAQCIEIFPPNKSQAYTGCIHGMGHGLFTWEHYDVAKALSDCDALASVYRSYCYDGVFMERSMQMNPDEFDPKNPWQFCASLDPIYQFNCARYQAQIFLAQDPQLAKVGQKCASINKEILSTTCLESLGHQVAQTNIGNLNAILDQCGQLANDRGYHCIIGAASEVIFQKYSDWQKTSEALCATLSGKWQEECKVSNIRVKEAYENK